MPSSAIDRVWLGVRNTVLALVLALAGATAAQAQILDDFNDLDDSGWTHYDPIAVGSWNASSGAYRIATSASGAGRAGSVRGDLTAADFAVAATVSANAGPSDQSFGVAGRLGQLGFATTDGYALLLRPNAPPRYTGRSPWSGSRTSS